MVQAHRISSNLLDPHPHRDSMVRLYRTFSYYSFTGETRFAGCLCTSSGCFKYIEPPRTFSNHISARCLGTSLGWVKHIEPPRTFSNLIIAERARCVEFFHMSSGWFDCPEPSLTTSVQGQQGLQGDYARVRGGSSASNLLEPSRTTSSQR